MGLKSGMTKIFVGRYINGITLNGLEYLLDDKGEIRLFVDENQVLEFLKQNGFSDADIEDLVFQESEGEEEAK